MPIMPSPTIGWRGGDTVIPDSVGYAPALSALLADFIGFPSADLFLRAAIDGDIDLSSSIDAAIDSIAATDAGVSLDQKSDLLARFLIEAAVYNHTSVRATVDASITLSAVVAMIPQAFALAEDLTLGSTTVAASPILRSTLSGVVHARAQVSAELDVRGL